MKKVKNFVLIIILLTAFNINAFSQLSAGLMFGINMTTINDKAPSGTEKGFNNGSNFGFFLDYKFGDLFHSENKFVNMLSLQFEYSYAKRGPKFATDTIDYYIKNSYHEGYLVLKFTFPLSKKFKGFLLGGPYISYWTFSRSIYKISDVGVIYTNRINYSNEVQVIGDYSFIWSNINYGLCGGGGLIYQLDKFNSFFFEGRLLRDLTNSGKYNSNTQDYNARFGFTSLNFSIGYIYTFGSKKILKELFGAKR
ncbi:MAG: PorT family protein [Bacteroidales bacterium]|nr:PorT family protein [Bacteroidales bacterium]